MSVKRQVIRICFGFAVVRIVIGLKISRHILVQSDSSSLALCRLHVSSSSFHWFTGLSVPFLTGQSDWCDFGLTTLNQKILGYLQ